MGYWIEHPTDTAFISALSPQGVGQSLSIAERWPAGRYVIREHVRDASLATRINRPWGLAVKDVNGDVRIEFRSEPERE